MRTLILALSITLAGVGLPLAENADAGADTPNAGVRGRETAACEEQDVCEDLQNPAGGETTPFIGSVGADCVELWPPNHKMVDVTVSAVVAANGDENPTWKIVGVSSNEPANGTGDGHTSPDWEITGDSTVKLRAERSGCGFGRVYTITIQADAAGKTATTTINIVCPHHRDDEGE